MRYLLFLYSLIKHFAHHFNIIAIFYSNSEEINRVKNLTIITNISHIKNIFSINREHVDASFDLCIWMS